MIATEVRQKIRLNSDAVAANVRQNNATILFPGDPFGMNIQTSFEGTKLLSESLSYIDISSAVICRGSGGATHRLFWSDDANRTRFKQWAQHIRSTSVFYDSSIDNPINVHSGICEEFTRWLHS